MYLQKTLARLEEKNARIELLNQNNYDLAQYGLNIFSDLSPEEFQGKVIDIKRCCLTDKQSLKKLSV